MNFAILAATLFAVVSCSKHAKSTNNVWKTGVTYQYEVEGRVMSTDDSQRTMWKGLILKCDLTFHAMSTETLEGELTNVEFAHINQTLPEWDSAMQENLQYKIFSQFEENFEIKTGKGRFRQLTVPESMTIQLENLLKGLIGPFQYVSDRRLSHSSHDNLDREAAPIIYRKMETDITGNCEVLYSVAPMPYDRLQADQQQKLANFAQPGFIEVNKMKDYGTCDDLFSDPLGGNNLMGSFNYLSAVNFSPKSSVSKIIAGRNNTIYSVETNITFNGWLLSESIMSELITSKLLTNVPIKTVVKSRVNATLVAIEYNQAKSAHGPRNNRNAGSFFYRFGNT